MRSGHPSLRPAITRDELLAMWNDVDAYPIKRIALHFEVTTATIRRLANQYQREGAHVVKRGKEGWGW